MRARLLAAASTLLALLSSHGALAGPALLFDPADGRILYAEDADREWHPASLTKIMTAYLTFEALKQGKLTLDQRISYSALAAEQPPSKLGLNVGAQLTVDSALKALIIKSANDVAVMLAEAVSGSQPAFVAHMNNTAQRLGMEHTNFVNPNGLPALQQVTTARDLGKLARAVLKDYPEHAAYWSMNDARIGRIYLVTHNGLLHSFEGADGMKTGFICDSGFNVVASATRDGRKLMAVVLGEATGSERTVRAASLLEHGFQQYAWKTLFNTHTIDTAPDAGGLLQVTSVRDQVVSGECGTKRRKIRSKGKGNKKPRATEAALVEPAASGNAQPAKPTQDAAGSAANGTKPAKPNAALTTAPVKAAASTAPAAEKKPRKAEAKPGAPAKAAP